MTLRLTSRIVLFFLPLAAGLLVIVGALSYRSASESLERAAMADMLGNAIEKEAQLDMWFEERLDEIGVIARQAAVVEETATLIAAAHTSEGRSARALLMAELQPHLYDGRTHFSELFVMDPQDGRVVASTSPAEEGKLKVGHPYFDNGKADLYLQAPYNSADLAAPAMTAAVPLRATGGRVVAVLAARLDLAAINVIVRRRTGLHETEDSFLVNAGQYLVTQPRFIREPAVLRRKIDTEPARLAAAGNNGVTLSADYRGVPSIAAYRWDAKHQVGLIVKMDYSEALAPAYAFGRSVLLISSLALLGAAGLAVVLARTITRPLRMLHESVRGFGGAHTDQKLPTSAGDEVSALAAEFDQMTARIADSVTQLDTAKRGLQALLDAATEISIIATDTAGRITMFNPGAERMLGYRAEEMIHVRTPEILHDPVECLERSRQLTLELGRPVEGFDVLVAHARAHPFDEREWTYVRKDGSRLDVNIIVTAVRDSRNMIAGYLGIATDITERKRLETALRLNNRELAAQTRLAEAANRAKSEFLATMSHEIRTPMNGVVGMTELLLHTDLTTEQRDYAQLVLSSADSLLTLINDILDFSKIESGKLDLEAIDFSLRATLEEAAGLLAERAQSKGLEMACLILQNIPELVRGDPGRLRQIVTNLLGNAVKFTDAGEVVLRAWLAADDGDAVTIRVEIADTGAGISPEVQGRLFQSFSQADSSTTRKFGGTGLGLAISKRLAALMGGEIGVKSEPGKGSTFWFTVRLGKASANQLEPLSIREDLRGLYALAVDDNQTNLQVVSAQTRAWGMACDVSATGAEALKMIDVASRERPYDVAILDMQMPGMDGLQLAEAIRRDPSNIKMKLVLMTSMAERGQAKRARQLGIAACLTKPVRQSQLHDCLRTVLRPSAHAPAAAPPPPLIATTRTPDQGRNLGRPRVLLAEDNRTNQIATVRMLQILGYRVDVAVNGIEAVEACRNVDYQIVLMDNQMPEMDGLTAAGEVRTIELARGTPPVPIIALTANAMTGDREKCLAAGMTDYLTKPFRLEQLSTMLERWGHVSPVPSTPN